VLKPCPWRYGVQTLTMKILILLKFWHKFKKNSKIQKNNNNLIYAEMLKVL
jgi:hypothetical protein